MEYHRAKDVRIVQRGSGSLKKVLFLNHETELGGAELTLLGFFRSCDRENISCELIVPQEGPLSEEVRNIGVNVHTLALDRELLTVRRKSASFSFSRIVSLKRGVMELRKFIRERSPDVVVSNSIKSHVYGSFTMRGLSIPYGWRLHDIIDRHNFSMVQQKFLFWLARRCPKAIAGVSEAVCQPLRAGGAAEEKISVIYNGVDVRKFETSEGSGFQFTPGFTKEHFIITLPGRIMREKGDEVLIESAIRVVNDIPQARFVFAGKPFHLENDYQTRLEHRIEHYGLEKYFSFIGFQREMAHVYASSDVVVQPSLVPDSLPTVVLEAMASGKVVIASDAGGAGEIIDHGSDGFILPAGSVDALADKLIEIALNKEKYGTMRMKARLKISSKFSMHTYIEKMQSWLQYLSTLAS